MSKEDAQNFSFLMFAASLFNSAPPQLMAKNWRERFLNFPLLNEVCFQLEEKVEPHRASSMAEWAEDTPYVKASASAFISWQPSPVEKLGRESGTRTKRLCSGKKPQRSSKEVRRCFRGYEEGGRFSQIRKLTSLMPTSSPVWTCVPAAEVCLWELITLGGFFKTWARGSKAHMPKMVSLEPLRLEWLT